MNTIETRLEEMLALANAATAGPWTTCCIGCADVVDAEGELISKGFYSPRSIEEAQRNAELIAAARTCIPALVQVARDLWREYQDFANDETPPNQNMVTLMAEHITQLLDNGYCRECGGIGEIQTDEGTNTCGFCLGTGIAKIILERNP